LEFLYIPIYNCLYLFLLLYSRRFNPCASLFLQIIPIVLPFSSTSFQLNPGERICILVSSVLFLFQIKYLQSQPTLNYHAKYVLCFYQQKGFLIKTLSCYTLYPIFKILFQNQCNFLYCFHWFMCKILKIKK
jgi:hypothetical protein